MKAQNNQRLVVNSLEAMLLGLLILVAAYVSIGRLAIAHVNDYRVNIEELLSNALNVPVHIGALRGEWHYLDPKLEIDGFRIGNAAAGITFDHLSVELNSLHSFLERQIVVSDLLIDSLSLKLAQDTAGNWYVDGMPVADNPPDFTALLTSVPYLESIEMTSINIDVVTRNAHYQIRNQIDQVFELRADGDKKTMSLPLFVERLGDNPYKDGLQLLGEFSGDPRYLGDFFASLYLQVPSVELADLIPPIGKHKLEFTELDMSGEFWLEFDGEIFELRGATLTSAVTALVNGRQVDLLEDVRSEFVVVREDPSEAQLYFESLSANVGSKRLELDGMSVAYRDLTGIQSLALALPKLSIAHLVGAVSGLGERTALLSQQGIDTLSAMALTGELDQLFVHIDHLNTTPVPHLTAQIHGLGLKPHLALPGISHLDGFASMGLESGYLDIHNQAPFELNFESMFSKPWSFDTAQVRLNYLVKPEAIQLRSGLIELTEGELVAAGRVLVNLPADRANHTWGLEIGLRHADLNNANRYLPDVLSDTLREWLGRAILGGTVAEGGLLFHGSLFRDAPKIRKVHELYFDVDDAIVAYDPAWPPLQDLEATIYVNNALVESNAATAAIFDSRLEEISVRLPITAEGRADSIFVNGAVHGDFSDGVKILNETPLAALTGQMANAWVATGQMHGDINMNVPIGLRAGEPVRVDLSINIDSGDLFMSELDLAIKDIVGNFTYDSDRGLNSAPFTASIFGDLARNEIASTCDATGAILEILIVGDGRASIDEVYKWSGQALLAKALGKFDYHSVVRIPVGALESGMSVDITSDLQGVEIELPSPMAKLAADLLPMRYQQTFFESSDEISLSLGDNVHALLKSRAGTLVGGRIHFGPSPLGAVAFDKLRVTGAIEEADYGQWRQLSDELEGNTEVSLESEIAQTLASVDLQVGRLNIQGFELESVYMQISRQQDAWNVELTNELLKGLISIPDQEEAPIELDLDYLRFITTEAGADPMQGLDPVDLVPANFRAKNVTVDAESYGSWAFNFRPDDEGGAFEMLSANFKGLEIESKSGVLWRVNNESQFSHFVGVVKVIDLALALKQWGFASSIQGNNFIFDSDVKWSGSPTMIDINNIEGEISISAKDGRFVQAETSTGALKLLGVFDFASLARRFRFDFSDIVNEGFSFDKINGSARFNHGIVDVAEPITIEGASSIFRVGGQMNIKTGELDNDLIVTLPVGRNLPWYAAYSALANPLVGAGVFLAQKIFEDQINRMTSAKYKVSGTVDLPVVEFISIFNDSIRETPEAEAASEFGDVKSKIDVEPSPTETQ